MSGDKLIRVIVRPGSTIRGTTYLEATPLDLSDAFAEHLLKIGDVWTPEQFVAQADPKAPTIAYDLNEGERIMLRRALVAQGALFLKQKAAAVAGKKLLSPRLTPTAPAFQRFEEEIQHANDSLDFINRLSEKLLKGGRR